MPQSSNPERDLERLSVSYLGKNQVITEDALKLVLSLFIEAQKEDLRYFDAFNKVYEEFIDTSSRIEKEEEKQFLSVYELLLKKFIEKLDVEN